MAKKSLSKPTNTNVSAFLKQVAKTPVIKTGSVGRLIFAMDATASREPSWNQACQLQSQMFTETTKLGGLAIQLCYFRGLAEFDASAWCHTDLQLEAYMRQVYCLGGHTQIEQVLNHAIAETQQQKINALVYVGDCIEENVDRLYQKAGQLSLHGVPVFLFQEGYDSIAQSAFKQIAKLTHGAYCAFDTGSAQQLRDLLKAVAVYAAGGQKALENFNAQQGRVVLTLTQQQQNNK